MKIFLYLSLPVKSSLKSGRSELAKMKSILTNQLQILLTQTLQTNLCNLFCGKFYS